MIVSGYWTISGPTQTVEPQEELAPALSLEQEELLVRMEAIRVSGQGNFNSQFAAPFHSP